MYLKNLFFFLLLASFTIESDEHLEVPPPRVHHGEVEAILAEKQEENEERIQKKTSEQQQVIRSSGETNRQIRRNQKKLR